MISIYYANDTKIWVYDIAYWKPCHTFLWMSFLFSWAEYGYIMTLCRISIKLNVTSSLTSLRQRWLIHSHPQLTFANVNEWWTSVTSWDRKLSFIYFSLSSYQCRLLSLIWLFIFCRFDYLLISGVKYKFGQLIFPICVHSFIVDQGPATPDQVYLASWKILFGHFPTKLNKSCNPHNMLNTEGNLISRYLRLL